MSYIKHKSEESLEDYLEAILILEKRLGSVHAIDVASELGFTKASVSIAMKNLREKQFVIVDENNHLQLTDAGRQRAILVYERHSVLSDWLIRLGVNEKTAREDACRMEHDISEESFQAIKTFLKKF